MTSVVTTAPETFLKTSLNPIALEARSPEENWAKKRLGSRSKRSQTAGIRVAETRPSMRSTNSPWIAWKIAVDTARRTRNTHITPSLAEIGLGDHLVDKDAGRNRDRQAEQCSQKCQRQHRQ